MSTMEESTDIVNDSQDDSNVLNLDKCIIKVINNIKKSRSRPCLTLVNRGGHNLTMENLRIIINSLTEKNLICIKGNEGSESLCVLDQQDILSDDSRKI